MIQYPNKPWTDGQTFEHITQDGTPLTGRYDQANNTWEFTTGELADVIFTDDVYTRNFPASPEGIEAARKLFDASTELDTTSIVTQQDANWYLYDLIETVEGGSNLWISQLEPDRDANGQPLYPFWFNPATFQLKYYYNNAWLDKGFDRPTIVSENGS